MKNSKQTIIYALILIAQALLVSCASAQQGAVEEPTMALTHDVAPVQPLPYGFTIGNEEKNVVVSMEANPTTGYSWSYTVSNDSVLQEVSSNYVADEHAQGMVGVGGRQYYSFSPLVAGNVRVRFVYARPWEKQNPTTILTVSFSVATDGSITWKTPEVHQREQ